MRSIIPFLSLSALLAPVQALYFYIDGSSPKCFFEELPKDTLVVGHYTAEEYDENRREWSKHDGLTIIITVDVSPLISPPFLSLPQKYHINPPQEVFDNDHRVVTQKGSSSGRFTFSAAASGDHKICFTPSSTSGSSGWLSALQPQGGIKLTLDLAIGATSAIESTDKGKILDIVQKVKDLNGRLQDIRREQVFQRVCISPSPALFSSKKLVSRCESAVMCVTGGSELDYKLTNGTNRNAKQNSEINPSQPIQGWLDGP